jgi:CRISPR/Cas system-associated exonuclease Cas4 (RecB family)
VSPSRGRALRECFLRVAFAQSSAAAGQQSDAQLIGDAAHAVLARLIAPGPPFGDRLAHLVADFEDVLEQMANGRKVRGARAAAARLKNLATHAIALVDDAGEPVELRCEQRLTGREGTLNGIVDLSVVGPRMHAVVDYKTGKVLDEDGLLAAHLRDQLALYCVLERERTGEWPDRAIILRFGGAPIEWVVDDQRCEQAASEVEMLRGQYLQHLGRTPPASPSPGHCRQCSFAARCEPFWNATDERWAETVLAVRGTVDWTQRTSTGTITVRLIDVEGTTSGDAVIQGLTPEKHSDVSPGSRLALAGLWSDRDGLLNAGEWTRSWS